MRGRAFLTFAGVAALVFLPWPVRTALMSGGNPVHPYFATVFHPEALPPGELAKWVQDTRRTNVIGGWRDRLLHPWILSVRQAETPHHVGPWALIAAPLALVALRRRGSPEAVLAGFAVGYWALWAPASMGVRFLLPALPPLGLAAGIVWFSTAGARFRAAGAVLAAGICAIGIHRNATSAFAEEAWRVPAGLVSREAFLAEDHLAYGFPPYPAYLWLNRQAPPGARVLLLGETRGAYLERPFLVGDTFDWPPVTDFVQDAGDGEAIFRRLRGAGVTYLLVNVKYGGVQKILGRWHTPERDRPVFESFFNTHARKVFSTSQGLGVFEVVETVPPRQKDSEYAGAAAWGPELLRRWESGEAHAHAHRWREALADFEWLYAHGQRVEENLGLFHLRLGETSRARAWFERAIARDPGSPARAYLGGTPPR